MPILLGKLHQTVAKSPWGLLTELFEVDHLVFVVICTIHNGAELLIVEEVEAQIK